MKLFINKFKNKVVDIKRFLQYGDLPTSYYIKRGMKVGKNFNRQSGTRFDPANCWLITIGDDVNIANNVRILAHDFSACKYNEYFRLGRVIIGDRSFIGANVTILTNVHIGKDVIISAGSVVSKDIPDNSVAAGNPAEITGRTSDFVAWELFQISKSEKVFDLSYSYLGKITPEKKVELLDYLEHHPGKSAYLKFPGFIS